MLNTMTLEKGVSNVTLRKRVNFFLIFILQMISDDAQKDAHIRRYFYCLDRLLL